MSEWWPLYSSVLNESDNMTILDGYIIWPYNIDHKIWQYIIDHIIWPYNIDHMSGHIIWSIEYGNIKGSI